MEALPFRQGKLDHRILQQKVRSHQSADGALLEQATKVGPGVPQASALISGQQAHHVKVVKQVCLQGQGQKARHCHRRPHRWRATICIAWDNRAAARTLGRLQKQYCYGLRKRVQHSKAVIKIANPWLLGAYIHSDMQHSTMMRHVSLIWINSQLLDARISMMPRIPALLY